MINKQILDHIDSKTNIQWQTECCDEHSVLFYKFNRKDENEKSIFLKRIKNIKFKVCILNTTHKGENFVCLSDAEYTSLQEELLCKVYPLKSTLSLIGVTGTNGKTTTVDLIRQLCILNKKKVLTFGTLGSYKNSEVVENFNLTTPSLIDGHKLIWEHQDEIDVVVFELSSHALEQNRLGHLRFDSLGWTNFTQDHLDFHGTMEKYFEAKSKIAKLKSKKGKVFVTVKLKEYIEKMNFSFQTIDEYEEAEHTFFKLDFNKSNLNMALALLRNVFSEFKNFPTKLQPAPGRFDILSVGDGHVAIDYAHTPDALSSICREVKNHFPDFKLKLIFGCGGDRDRHKRSVMGKAASEYADYIFLTSDNPRFEDPKLIIEDIVGGISTPFEIEVDRKQAIRNALSKLGKDVLIIAGKGHEDYIDKEGVKFPYSDRAVVEEFIRESEK